MMIILLRLGKFLNLESFKSHIPTFTKESCLKFKKFAMDWRLKLVNFHFVYNLTQSWMENLNSTWKHRNICYSIWLYTRWQCKLCMTFCFDIQIIQIYNPHMHVTSVNQILWHFLCLGHYITRIPQYTRSNILKRCHTQHDFKGCIRHLDLCQKMIKLFLFKAYDKSLLLEAYKPHWSKCQILMMWK